MHSLSKAITGAAVAAIPCGTDLRQMRMDIDATRIRDPLLAQEVADFSHACYGPARARLFMKRPTLRYRPEMQMAQFKSEMAQQETKLLIRMGMMFSAAVGILVGAMKLFQ